MDASLPWRLPLLALAVVLIVVTPFMLLGVATQRTLDASNRVAHTREVEAAVNAQLYDVRNRESSALALVNGIDTPLIRARIAKSTHEIPAGVDKIIRLTRDDPDQQVRIGMLRATVEQREALVGRVFAAGPGPSLHEDLVTMVTRFPIRDIAA